MDQRKLNKTLDLIADSIVTGYSSVYTFAVKENLDTEERREVAELLRNFTKEHRS